LCREETRVDNDRTKRGRQVFKPVFTIRSDHELNTSDILLIGK
jgi:hypothetical protein